MTAPHPRDAGITLIEMLVALIIFAMVGMASFTTLDTILKVRARTDGRLEQIARIDRALLVFGRDWAQVDPLTVTLAEGSLRADISREKSLRRYLLRDGALIRESGDTQTTDPLAQALVNDVRDLRFEVMDLERIWHEGWPSDSQFPQARAVRMALTFASGETLSRTVALPQALIE